MASPELNDSRITQEAADWLVDLPGANDARRAEFLEWLRRSPEHVREFLGVTGLARRMREGIDPQRLIDVQGLMAGDAAEIVRLPVTHEVKQPGIRGTFARRNWILATAATIAVAVCLSLLLLRSESYSTGIGEQQSFKLSDGSVIYLNTDTEATVNFSASVREVRLLRGEALFSVQKDAKRPFRVSAGGTTVQVLGTEFNVYRRPDASVAVAVIEGTVGINGTEVRLNAGDEASVRTDGRLVKQTMADITSAVAWRSRQLVFSKTPLTEVAAQFNRYNRRQIHIGEDTARQRQITGVFAADRPDSFLLFLARDEELQIDQSGQDIAIRSRVIQP